MQVAEILPPNNELLQTVSKGFYQNRNLSSFCSYLDEKHNQTINPHHFGLNNLTMKLF
jgi:hypothetical protein